MIQSDMLLFYDSVVQSRCNSMRICVWTAVRHTDRCEPWLSRRQRRTARWRIPWWTVRRSWWCWAAWWVQ